MIGWVLTTTLVPWFWPPPAQKKLESHKSSLPFLKIKRKTFTDFVSLNKEAFLAFSAEKKANMRRIIFLRKLLQQERQTCNELFSSGGYCPGKANINDNVFLRFGLGSSKRNETSSITLDLPGFACHHSTDSWSSNQCLDLVRARMLPPKIRVVLSNNKRPFHYATTTLTAHPSSIRTAGQRSARFSTLQVGRRMNTKGRRKTCHIPRGKVRSLLSNRSLS